MKVCKAAIALWLLCLATVQGCVGVAATGTAVGGAVAQDRRTPGSYVDDELIELKVRAAIHQDATLASQSHVNATSFNGTVLLTGEAPGKSLRDRLTDIARNTVSVRGVENHVELRAPSTFGSRTNDTLITGKVKLALLRDDKVNAARVKVVTERAAVYLMGLLRQDEADRATEIARRVPGVRRVVKVIEYIE